MLRWRATLVPAEPGAPPEHFEYALDVSDRIRFKPCHAELPGAYGARRCVNAPLEPTP